jgi:hypothetical protein
MLCPTSVKPFFSGGAFGKKSPFLLVLFFWRSKRKVRQHEQIMEFLYNYFKNADMPPSGLPGCRNRLPKYVFAPIGATQKQNGIMQEI